MKTLPDRSEKFETIAETPEPFRSTLEDPLYSTFSPGWILYGPSIPAGDEITPATVLAVNGDGWLLATENPDGTVSIERSTFSETLFVQLTSIVLWGQLKIDFASVGRSYSAVIGFSTVDEKLYREAVDRLLQGIEETGRPAAEEQSVAAMIEEWPLGFRNEVLSYLPKGQRLLAAARWPAILGGFRRELAPAGALLVTERELVLFSEENTPEWYQDEWAKYGGIITYFPLARLEDFHVSHQERFSLLALEVHARHGGERLEIVFPSDHERAITKALEQTRASAISVA